jgi:hypothetical protein
MYIENNLVQNPYGEQIGGKCGNQILSKPQQNKRNPFLKK